MSTFHIYKLRYIIAPLDGFFENNREDIIELNNDYNDATRLLAGNDS